MRHQVNVLVIFNLLSLSLNVFAIDFDAAYQINKDKCSNILNAALSMGLKTTEDVNIVSSCTRRQMDNYRNGLPSYATHPDSEVDAYLKQENRRKLTPEQQNSTQEVTIRTCQEIPDMYQFFLDKKTSGAKREDMIAVLRQTQESNNNFFVSMIYGLDIPLNMIKEIYGSQGPISPFAIDEQKTKWRTVCVQTLAKILGLE